MLEATHPNIAGLQNLEHWLRQAADDSVDNAWLRLNALAEANFCLHGGNGIGASCTGAVRDRMMACCTQFSTLCADLDVEPVTLTAWRQRLISDETTPKLIASVSANPDHCRELSAAINTVPRVLATAIMAITVTREEVSRKEVSRKLISKVRQGNHICETWEITYEVVYREKGVLQPPVTCAEIHSSVDDAVTKPFITATSDFHANVLSQLAARQCCRAVLKLSSAHAGHGGGDVASQWSSSQPIPLEDVLAIQLMAVASKALAMFEYRDKISSADAYERELVKRAKAIEHQRPDVAERLRAVKVVSSTWDTAVFRDGNVLYFGGHGSDTGNGRVWSDWIGQNCHLAFAADSLHKAASAVGAFICGACDSDEPLLPMRTAFHAAGASPIQPRCARMLDAIEKVPNLKDVTRVVGFGHSMAGFHVDAAVEALSKSKNLTHAKVRGVILNAGAVVLPFTGNPAVTSYAVKGEVLQIAGALSACASVGLAMTGSITPASLLIVNRPTRSVKIGAPAHLLGHPVLLHGCEPVADAVLGLG